MKIVVLDGFALNPGDLSWDKLKELGETVVYDRTPSELVVERAQGADVLLTNKTVINAAAIEALPGVKYIGVLATGYNVVDVEAAAKRGIVVTNVPDYSTKSVVQLTFALLLELCNQTKLHSDAVRQGGWQTSEDFCFTLSPLVELHGKTFGVIGFGSIGRQAAAVASAFGMNVVVPDRGKPLPPEFGYVKQVPMEELFAQADVVSLHCPLTPDTKGIINKGNLSLMKRTAFLINTARGPLVVEEDLAEALDEGIIAGAGIDVVSVEPPRAGNPLFQARNCIITPHIAWATLEARARLMDIAVGNLQSFRAGEIRNQVG